MVLQRAEEVAGKVGGLTHGQSGIETESTIVACAVAGAGRPELPSRALRRVPLWSAVAASLLMASLGFAVGVNCHGTRSADTPETRPPVRVELICDSPSGTNPFDFTAASSDVPDREWEIVVISDAETST